MKHRTCAHCGGMIPVAVNARSRYCKRACKDAAYKARKAQTPGDGFAENSSVESAEASQPKITGQPLPANLREVLDAAAWIAHPDNEDGILWTCAVSEMVGRDAHAELEELVALGLLRFEYVCEGERIYTLTERAATTLREAA